LLLLSFLTLAALWALAAGVFRLAQGERTRPEVDRFVRHYVDYLAGDLGQPPNAAKGEALASKTGWQFRWEPIKGQGWATGPDLPSSAELQAQTRHPGGDSGWRHGRFFFLLRQPAGTLVLLAQAWTPPQFNKAWLWLLGFGACFILSFSFLFARSMLRPLRQLDQALASFATGDLTARLPDARHPDELGRLTLRFNQMATEVGRMLDSRRQLLLDVSHELRTPLTRLNLGLELMKDDAARASLKEDVAEMEAMLAELLEGARVEQAARLQPQPVDLAGLLKEVAQDMDGRSPGLALDLPAAPLNVLGDERGLRILLRNLCDNALKYSGAQAQKVEVKLWQADGWAHLELRDHGPGITEEALPHLFEPFYRADASRNRSTGGFGLGLHLVQKVAMAHGGEVKVANASEGGAVFSVALPAMA
jgi:signal transduction histidine kinase